MRENHAILEEELKQLVQAQAALSIMNCELCKAALLAVVTFATKVTKSLKIFSSSPSSVLWVASSTLSR